MVSPPVLSAAERRRFAPIIAERVDELEPALADVERVDELERLICLAAVRFQSGEVPGGAVDMLVAELERRGSAQAAALLGGFAKLGAPMLAEPAKAARARMAADGVTVGPLEEELGALRAVDVRCAELLRAQLWTFEIERVDAPGVQAAAVALEHDGDGLIVARGLLTGPLGAAETIDSFRPGGPDVE